MVLEDHAASVAGGAEPGEDPVEGVVTDDEDAPTAVVVDATRLVVDPEVLGAGAA
jgi:hypothetical protein